MKNIFKSAKNVTMLLSVVFGFVLFIPTPAMAEQATFVCGDGDNIAMTIFNGIVCAKPDGTPNDIFGVNGIFAKITNTAMFLVGAISVIMLIFGGIRYTLSGGDATKVTAAKNTILYAIIGIIVALLAYAAVSFVIGQLATPAVTTT